jgi:threonine dehydrogenase-like Zn-dependent dehydrogenase
MKAVRLPGGGKVEVIERPIPVPGPHEVLIKVRASAICASDLSLLAGEALVGGAEAGQGRFTPGHEPAGEIVELGRDVAGLKVGDRVAVHLSLGCMRCEYCRAGSIQQCPQWKCVGFDVDGGDAEYIVAPDVACLPLPDGFSYASGALLVDNFGTQYHTQKRLGVSGADIVTIVGIGPMGAAAVATAKGRGAQVIALDRNPPRIDLAGRLGADYTIDASQGDPLDRIMEITGGHGSEISIDCSGHPDGENLALNATAKLGKVAFVGECPSLTISPSEQMIRKELEVIGAWVFPIQDYFPMTRFLLRQGIIPESTIGDRFAIHDAPEAFDRVNRRLTDKVIFTFD